MKRETLFHTLFALWAMSRPLIMVSVILVCINGLLIARYQGYTASWSTIWWGLAALIAITTSIHYANEYADYETDTLTTPTLYSGGSGVLPKGEVPRHLALQGAWVSLTVGFGIALMGYSLGFLGKTALFCLALGSLGGWMYSLPPLKLAWRGWGELVNALLGGLLLHVYGHALFSDQIRLKVLLICLPFTLLTFNNLLATTWADKQADKLVGKRTLAAQLTIRHLRRLYAAVAIVAFVLLILLRGWIIPIPVVYASTLALPMVIWGWQTYTRIHNPYPSSNAMVVSLLAQMIAWYTIA